MGVAVLVPIAGVVFVLRVEIVGAGDVVISDEVDVVVWQDLLLLVGVFRHLELILLMGALMSVPGRLLVASSVEVPAAA